MLLGVGNGRVAAGTLDSGLAVAARPRTLDCERFALADS